MIRSASRHPASSAGESRSAPGRTLLLLVVLVIVAAGVFVVWRYHPGLSLLRNMLTPLQDWNRSEPVTFALLFFAITVAVTGLCIPIEILLGLVGGAVFGIAEGVLLVSFGSSIGATVTFLGSRFLLRDTVDRYFPKGIDNVNRGLERDGAVYLFTLRLLPVIPFTLVNILMGLTELRTAKFYLVSQIGMLPATLIYVNAGTQLSRINSVYDIVSPPMLIALVLIGLFPWLAKGVAGLLRGRRGSEA